MKTTLLTFLVLISATSHAIDLNLNGTISGGYTYPTDGSITSTATIETSARPTFLAKGTITLLPGFWAKTPSSAVGFRARIDTFPAAQPGDINIYILNPNFAMNQIGKFGYSVQSNTLTYRGSLDIPKSFLTGVNEHTEIPIFWRDSEIYLHNPVTRMIGRFNPTTGAKNSEFSCAPGWGRFMSIDPGSIGDIVLCTGGALHRVRQIAPHYVGSSGFPSNAITGVNSMVGAYYLLSSGLVTTGSSSFASPPGSRLMAGTSYFFNPSVTSAQLTVLLNGTYQPATDVPGHYLTQYSSVHWMIGNVGVRSTETSTSPNQAPSIISAPWANPNPTVFPAPTSVNVVAVDADKGPLPLTYTWSKVSGPGDVTFESNGTATANSSQASFSKPGSYSVKVVVSDGKDTAEGLVPIVVSPPPAAKKNDF